MAIQRRNRRGLGMSGEIEEQRRRTLTREAPGPSVMPGDPGGAPSPSVMAREPSSNPSVMGGNNQILPARFTGPNGHENPNAYAEAATGGGGTPAAKTGVAPTPNAGPKAGAKPGAKPGLSAGKTPSFAKHNRPDDVSKIATGIMRKDSPLMKLADTQGRQFANRRGLMNSSMAGQASRAAALDYVVPMASQTAAQAHEKNLQGGRIAFEQGQNALDRRLKTTLLGKQLGHDRRQNAQNRKLQAFMQGRDLDLKRYGLNLDAKMKNADRKLRDKLAKLELTAGDRRNVTTLLNNAFNDYEDAQRSILANTNLPAGERNKLLKNAKRLLQMKIDYVSDLYGDSFNPWPTNIFGEGGGAGGGRGAAGGAAGGRGGGRIGSGGVRAGDAAGGGDTSNYPGFVQDSSEAREYDYLKMQGYSDRLIHSLLAISRGGGRRRRFGGASSVGRSGHGSMGTGPAARGGRGSFGGGGQGLGGVGPGTGGMY